MGEMVLCAEDDLDFQFLLERTLKRLAFPVDLRCVTDGEKVIRYLMGEGDFADRERFPLPTVLFLDIKMPRVNGFEVLQWLQNNNVFKRLQVVMMSSSAMPADIDRAYKLGANAYVVKSADLKELQKLFKSTGEFFVEDGVFLLSTVEKPPAA
jgi:CheY-like chemotaxis protein